MKCKLNKRKKASLERNYRKYFRLHWLNFPTTLHLNVEISETIKCREPAISR